MTDSSMSLIYLSVWIPIKDQMQSNCLCGWVNFYRLKGFQVRSTAHMASVQWISFGIIGNWRNRAECSVFPQSIYRSIYVGYQTALCEFTRTNTGDEQQLYEMSLYRYSNSKYSAVCIDNLFHLPFRSLRSFKVELSQLKKEKLHFKALLTKCQQHHTLQYFLCRMTVFKPFIMSECFLIIIILNVL